MTVPYMQLIVMCISQDGNDSGNAGVLIAHYGLADAARRHSWQSTGDKLCKPTPPDSLQKAANRSIFACVLLVLLLWGALAHYLPSLDHSRYFHADIFNVALPLLSAMLYTRAERCFFTVALSRCSSPHLPVLCTSLLLSVTGNLFLPDPPPAPPPLSEARGADKTGEPRKR